VSGPLSFLHSSTPLALALRARAASWTRTEKIESRTHRANLSCTGLRDLGRRGRGITQVVDLLTPTALAERGHVDNGKRHWLRRRWLTVLLVGVVLEGCFVGAPWTQRVDLALFRDGEPVARQHFKFVDRESTDACASPGLEGTTDAQGRFSGRRKQWSTALGLAFVLVRHDMLCIRDAGEWKSVWQVPYGPAPEILALTCDLARADASRIAACRFGDRPFH
jgi:hypothetical protein